MEHDQDIETYDYFSNLDIKKDFDLTKTYDWGVVNVVPSNYLDLNQICSLGS